MTNPDRVLGAEPPAGDPDEPSPRASDWVDLNGLSFAPTARVLRRSRREIQIERADSAVVVADLPEFIVADLHQGHEHRRPVHRDAAGAVEDGPVDTAEVGRVLRSLTRAGYLVRRDSPDSDAAAGGDVNAQGVPATGRARALGPDLAALADRFGRRAHTVLDRRHRYSVLIHGTGRIASLVAALLAASGVGLVDVPDSGNVTLGDVLPGGLLPINEGERTALAAAEAVRRARPGGTGPPLATGAGDLVISTDGYPVSTRLRADLIGEPRPLLVSGVWGSRGVIGPLVVPGHTSCLHCADLHRCDRDPAWPVLAAQLARAEQAPAPSEVVVCALTAAVTVAQALAFLDGERPATADGTLEFCLPDWRLRRRHWARHADCPCAA